MSRTISRLRSRVIADCDIDTVVELLVTGFPVRSRKYWQHGLQRLEKRPTPYGLPRYGYLLENDDVPVGVVLLIFSESRHRGVPTIRCNISSWYVEPEFRPYASLLISRALRHENVTYLNISPAPHTLPTIEAQGFIRYTNGQFVCSPALAFASHRASVTFVDGTADPGVAVSAFDRDMLLAHAGYGAISLWCVTDEGALPFVFWPRRIKRIVSAAQLIYCADPADFVRFARPLGCHLACRGIPFVIVDCDGPIAGFIGMYFEGKLPKYYRGPTPPAIGDLAHTEVVIFGL
jgi:hypothetical protein